MAKLVRTLSKSGKYFTFSIPGVRGQLHIAPKMVQGSCPTAIEVTGIEFAEAGAVDAAVAAERAAKAQAAVDKAQARLVKALAKVAPVAEQLASDVPEGDAAVAADRAAKAQAAVEKAEPNFVPELTAVLAAVQAEEPASDVPHLTRAQRRAARMVTA